MFKGARLTVEDASKLAIRAMAADIEYALTSLVDNAGRVGLNDAIKVLDQLRETTE